MTVITHKPARRRVHLAASAPSPGKRSGRKPGMGFLPNVGWGGDADQWYANAVTQGAVTSLVPAVGEIVVYAPGGFYAGVGHVAVVVAVSTDSYTVSEMNFAGNAVVDERTLSWPDPSVVGFIT